jgi:hypothetical protein
VAEAGVGQGARAGDWEQFGQLVGGFVRREKPGAHGLVVCGTKQAGKTDDIDRGPARGASHANQVAAAAAPDPLQTEGVLRVPAGKSGFSEARPFA